MQDEYIDEAGRKWRCAGEGITIGYESVVYYRTEFWVFNDDGLEFRSTIDPQILDAAWAALKGETQKAPCGAQVQPASADA
jgi:hypothetical protein